MDINVDRKSKKPSRSYSQKTLKVLFALSRNECSWPGCTEKIISDKTEKSDELVVGQIAHIYAISEDGPRGKAGLTSAQLNEPANLLLLCPTHHVIVDGQHETYPAQLLLDWKAKHEKHYRDGLSDSISDVGFAELEVAAKALMAASSPTAPGSLAVIPPQDKIERNDLGPTSSALLSMGAAKSAEVGEVLVKATGLDPEFPIRLSAGFIAQYEKAKAEGLSGDAIFNELYAWVGGGGGNKEKEAAGLCFLAHLFIICDIFEK